MAFRMNLTRGIGSTAILLVCSGLFISGAARADEKKTLKAVVHADLKILDPVWTSAWITLRYGYCVYDTLFALDSSYIPKPQMVDTYKVSADSRTYSFTLRPGLKWHDGQPVRPEDCIASLKRWMQRHPMGQKLGEFVQTLEPLDKLSFKMVLKEPYGIVLRTLAAPSAAPFIMPERVAKTPPNTQIKEHIGSGPFRFKADEWQPGHKTVFERNKDYIPRKEPADLLSGGKVVKIDRLEWLYIPDNNTTLSALTAGEIDYFEAPPLEYIQVLKKNPDIVVQNIDMLGVQGLIKPNHLHPPFNHPKARQALFYLVDQEEFMGAVAGDPELHLKYCGTFFMCGSENETPAGLEGLRKPNVEKAKQLFKEAGYKGEAIVVLQPTDRPQYNAATMVLIQQLRKAGVNVQPKAADWSTISSIRAKKDPPGKGGWHLFLTSHGNPDTATPVGNGWFNSRCERAQPGWPCDPTLMDLVDKWARATDKKEQRKILDAIQVRALETVPYVPYGQYFSPIAVRSNVRGVLKAGLPVYWNIEKR